MGKFVLLLAFLFVTAQAFAAASTAYLTRQEAQTLWREAGFAPGAR